MVYAEYCHFITWICPMLSDVFVPSCPMYWCIFRLYVVKTYQEKKNAWLLDKTSLCSCAYGPVFQPVLWFSPFPSSPHTSHSLCSKARPAPFISALIFHSTDPLNPNKRTKEVASVVFERFCSCRFLLLFLNQLWGLWRLLRGDHIHCLDVLEILWGVPKLVPK